MAKFEGVQFQTLPGEPILPLDREQIHDLERNYQILLPGDYVCFLETCNGGYPSRSRFTVNGEQISVNRVFFIRKPEAPTNEKYGLAAEGGWDYGNVVEEMPRLIEQTHRLLLPIADDGFGNFIAFDYEDPDVPLVFFEHEDEFRPMRLASTFTEFVRSLR